MNKWLSAMRLRTLPLAASCTLTGAALGWQLAENPVIIFVLALATTFLLQILSNLANDYGDYVSGVDNANRVGPERALQSGAITKSDMKWALIICALLAFICGILLLWFALATKGLFMQALLFLIVGIAAIAAAFKYTIGKNPYGYRAFGDVAVFIFFGMVGVGGTYFLFTTQWSYWVLLPATTIGLLSCAVLNLNNMRDHVNDAASNKITLVVKMGFQNAKAYQTYLIALALLALSIYGFFNFCKHPKFHFAIKWLSLLPFIMLFANVNVVWNAKNPALLDPELKKVALSTFLLALILFITSNIL
jgi:1,4-dihydroxy-2-naphthoate polyprenyltransferase